jgi:hypothetical protein
MLYSSLGERLETLCLEFLKLQGTPHILLRLKNLPVLKKLILKSVTIRLNALEEIHRNVPSIQNLSLVCISVLQGNMPADIMPATCITKLKFDTGECRSISFSDIHDMETHDQLYQYMAKKYTKIKNIDYIDETLTLYPQVYCTNIYLNGLLDFLKLIVPIRNELTLQSLPDVVDPFEALDYVDARINKLKLLECNDKPSLQYLCHSKQPKYIQDLYLLDVRLYSVDFLKDITTLTSLTVRYSKRAPGYICVSDCLAACPPHVKFAHYFG